MTEIIKFDRIVSVSSEVQGHGAQNILRGEISPSKNWMCEAGTEKAVVILQLERAAVLTSVHVGNVHSAFVEVLVGKAADSSDHFQSLVPMSFFMNPNESKTGTNPNRTRFFTKKDFSEAAATKSWDRVKIVCSQPFNKCVSYGLCFVTVHGEKEPKKPEASGRHDDQGDIQIGSFFRRKRASAGDKPLTVSEQIKEAEKEPSLLSHSPISIAKISERMSSGKRKKSFDESRAEEPNKSKEEAPNLEKRIRSAGKREEDSPPKKGKEEKREKNDKTGRRGRRREEVRKSRRKPFEKLMEDVVLVISGYKNPLRGEIRSMALKMGASYSADWDSHCTHLVCAFENTPKCQQVRGKGKMVRKEWVERCHGDRKRYPWRRFALEKTDSKKAESEEEVEAGEESEPEEKVETSSTERAAEGQEKVGGSSSVAKPAGDEYEAVTDDDEKKEVDTTDYPMPFLPDIFSLKTFFLDPNLQCRPALERYIVAYKGVLSQTFDEKVDFYVTERGGAPVELFRKKAPNLVAVKPSWIWEINSKQKYTPTTPHIVK